MLNPAEGHSQPPLYGSVLAARLQFRDPKNYASASLACHMDLVSGSCSQPWLHSLATRTQRAQLQASFMVVSSLVRSFGPIWWTGNKGGSGKASASRDVANRI